MCVFSSPKVPAYEPQPQPKEVDAGVKAARSSTKRRAQAAAGMSSTVRSSNQGVLAQPVLAHKTLFGQ